MNGSAQAGRRMLTSLAKLRKLRKLRELRELASPRSVKSAPRSPESPSTRPRVPPRESAHDLRTRWASLTPNVTFALDQRTPPKRRGQRT